MAVFRVEKNKGYTVMSNHHLRNKELTLKAKGLLSQMLSLPENWDYTLAGLSHINKESIDAIRTAVWELEKAGYIKRSQGRDEKGKMTAITYTIYEQPQNPVLENPMQLNKDIQNTDPSKKEEINKDGLNTDSIPILSPNPSPLSEQPLPEKNGKEEKDAYKIYEEIIKDNIEYEHLISAKRLDRDRIDEILDLILETVCSKRKRILIAGDEYPAELVKAKFMKLNSDHIEFVLCSPCNLIDIDPNFLKLCRHFLYIAVIDLNDISVYRHFPKVRFHISCRHLFHFFFNQAAFFFRHTKFNLHISFSVIHR
ncbi:hypothetical protein HMP0721_0166 [Pseudoramibacter alactolyticus ATCC 23263]|uniref:DUF6017 domain-containing protein n=1 Tax=Pseudoramibacter alactolyticus ATCC 23263 TaxID=887929 RepID=E6MDT3_9FIRM|nr:DUF6017 domain-containing protein [Pseudoramibacter alactolyticus]EFV02692.1 hypothetical protein HMP0721_0166 [Pseudoramibacter alactolyticus ATCC 23263]